jgi:hypothetical protein
MKNITPASASPPPITIGIQSVTVAAIAWDAALIWAFVIPQNAGSAINNTAKNTKTNIPNCLLLIIALL